MRNSFRSGERRNKVNPIRDDSNWPGSKMKEEEEERGGGGGRGGGKRRRRRVRRERGGKRNEVSRERKHHDRLRHDMTLSSAPNRQFRKLAEVCWGWVDGGDGSLRTYVAGTAAGDP